MAMREDPNRQKAALDFDLSDPTGETQPLDSGGSIKLTIDMTRPGKQHGHLYLPCGDPFTSAHQLQIPVCVLTGDRPGPTITLISGIYHDEFDGPLALEDLIRTLSIERISGKVILLPSLNLHAFSNRHCQSALAMADLDQCFPGNPNGSVGLRMAYEVLQQFIKPADWVVDIRSGEKSMQYSGCTLVRFHDDKLWQRETEKAMFAFGAPNSVRLPANTTVSCLQSTVAAMGKHYIQVRLGGGAGCNIDNLNTARSGCRNLLRQCGCLDDEIELSSTRLLEVRNESYYVFAPVSGLLEPCVHLGREIWKGDPLAKIVSLENSGQKPTIVDVPRDSILLAYHRGGPVCSGDLLAILADEVRS